MLSAAKPSYLSNTQVEHLEEGLEFVLLEVTSVPALPALEAGE